MKNEGTVPSPAQHQQGGNEAKRSSVELRSLNEFFSLLESCMGLTTSPDIDAIANYARAPGFRTLLPCPFGSGTPDQLLDRLAPTKACSGLPCGRAGGDALLSLRKRDGSGGKEAVGTHALCPL